MKKTWTHFFPSLIRKINLIYLLSKLKLPKSIFNSRSNLGLTKNQADKGNWNLQTNVNGQH